jgi:hypothetical protein
MTAPAGAPAATEAPAAPAATEAPAAEEGAKTFSADYVQSLRDEAAKHRTAKNDAVAAAKAVLTDQHASALAELTAAKDAELTDAVTQLQARSTELLKIKAVLEAGVPSDSALDVADLVQGNTPETISESVLKVTSLLGKPPARVAAVDSTQGTGGQIPLNGNPVLDILKAAVGAK